VVQAAGALPRVWSLPMNSRQSILTIAADTEPTSIVLDPNVSLLADFGTFVKTGTR
jgi:hypothetical protein